MVRQGSEQLEGEVQEHRDPGLPESREISRMEPDEVSRDAAFTISTGHPLRQHASARRSLGMR
jgi:hypothetical protein